VPDLSNLPANILADPNLSIEDVLPILAALLPAMGQNLDELASILPPEVLDHLEVHLAEELGDVLALTLRGASYRGGRLLFGDTTSEAAGDVPLHPGARRYYRERGLLRTIDGVGEVDQIRARVIEALGDLAR